MKFSFPYLPDGPSTIPGTSADDLQSARCGHYFWLERGTNSAEAARAFVSESGVTVNNWMPFRSQLDGSSFGRFLAE
jgi:hypothetical protein